MKCYLPWIVLFPSLGSLLGGEEYCPMVLNSPYPVASVSLNLYLVVFGVTVLTEALLMWMFWKKLSRKNLLGVLAANLVSHPAAVFLWVPYAATQLRLPIRDVLLRAELVIPSVEFLVYLGFSYQGKMKTFVSSYVSNLGSWALVSVMQVWGFFLY